MLLEGSSEEGLAEEPSVGCETLRAYCIGSLVALVGTAANVWFQARQPNIYISSFIALVLAHPLGRLWEVAVPQKTIRLPFGYCFQLNPGTWSIKEHTIVTVMATISLPSATAIDILAAIKLPVFFNDSRLGNDIFFQILVVLSTQLMGIGLAGLARDMIVRPKEMVWPINNAKIALLEAIHAKSRGTARAKDIDPGAWSMSTMRWGVYVCVASFAWHFVVEAVLPVFTYFDWTTWFAPENALLATITGTKNGLGLNLLPTLDWTFMSSAGLHPLISPWPTTVSLLYGATIGFIVTLLLCLTNTWYSAHLLPTSSTTYDRFAEPYKATSVLDVHRALDMAHFESYSPLYLSAGYCVVFGASFASYTSILVHAALEHRADILKGIQSFKTSSTRRTPTDDEEVPYSWFGSVTLVSLLMGIVLCTLFESTMPIWALFLSVGLVCLFLIPAGLVMAVSNVSIKLNVLAELIPGFLISERPYANMIFKVYAWTSLSQALHYSQDQKLGLCLGLPPRAVFRAQVLGALISCLASLAVINYQMAYIDDFCSSTQKDGFTCPFYTIFYTSALVYGLIGPQRLFGVGSVYQSLLWCFPLGALLTLLIWLGKRQWPNSCFRLLSSPVVINGAHYFAPFNWAYVW
ncbi:OPT superfamily oligopeptide transporter [Acaromyces ingoldii]|uniref:OPT superfamily oligopeptide transporter n=1 Tax=Acaromyces ingoldii TaxID=215250 RepID=A0A316YS91_9BASI|nr:OPT superfamily oligopeptide transporter [Acaromyces ingoldii]PWN91992.1 OPT superfamily oligopeptide transporter [Acaromyces ingoldii]